MVDWFGTLKGLPREPVQVNRFSKILNVKKYIETQTATIEATKADPFNRVFKEAYLRLYDLKKFIENE